MEGTPEKNQKSSRWVPPPDSDLIGIPLVLGLLVSLVVIVAAFALIGPFVGLLALFLVVVLGLVIGYRVLAAADVED